MVTTVDPARYIAEFCRSLGKPSRIRGDVPPEAGSRPLPRRRGVWRFYKYEATRFTIIAYESIMGRQATNSEYASMLSLLEARAVSRGQLLCELASTREAQARRRSRGWRIIGLHALLWTWRIKERRRDHAQSPGGRLPYDPLG